MTDDQINRHEMHRNVLQVLDDHADAWASVPLMQTHRDALAGYIQAFSEAAEAQGRSPERATAAKGQLRDKVADGAWRLGQATVAWGRATGRPDVVAAAHVTRTAFNDFRDADLARYSEVIVALAREHLDGLTARQGVPAAFVDALDADDDAFARDLAAPRGAIGARRTATLATVIHDVQELPDGTVDPTVAFLAPDQPAFADAYRVARVIVDRGRGRGTPPPDDEPAA